MCDVAMSNSEYDWISMHWMMLYADTVYCVIARSLNSHYSHIEAVNVYDLLLTVDRTIKNFFYILSITCTCWNTQEKEKT